MESEDCIEMRLASLVLEGRRGYEERERRDKGLRLCVAGHVVFGRGVGVGERPAVEGRRASSCGW